MIQSRRIENTPNWLVLGLVALLVACAAVGRPGGGPEDKSGPKLLAVEPTSGMLSGSEPIILAFDETLAASTALTALELPELSIRSRVRGKNIILRPEKSWPSDTFFRIHISRKLKDNQNNAIESAIELPFSTGAVFPEGRIIGRILGLDNQIAELGLFSMESDSLIRRTETDTMDCFQFNFLHLGEYRIAAILGNLNNITSDIRNKNYAIMSQSSIRIPEFQDSVFLRMSPAIERQKIQSVEFVNEFFAKIQLSNSTADMNFSTLANLPEIGDTVAIFASLTNMVEAYYSDTLFMAIPEVQDSIPPTLKLLSQNTDSIHLAFSEPIRCDSISENFTLFDVDSNAIPIDLRFWDNVQTRISCLPNWAFLEFASRNCTDFRGNAFLDSTIVFRFKQNEKIVETGQIRGRVNGEFTPPIRVIASPIEGNARFSQQSSDGDFYFDLPAGYYRLQAFEAKNPVHADRFFSGTWEPFAPAAAFTPADTVELRARWLQDEIQLMIK